MADDSHARSFDTFSESFSASPFTGSGFAAFSIPSNHAERSSFISPLLIEKDDRQDAVVTLLSARGAAGKTTAATELAIRLNSPAWRLEEDKAVSGTSLEYALSQYLKTHDVSAELRNWASPIVIIDSLDEARTRVSGASWTDFIESLGRLAQSGLRYVLLGRERTMEDVWVSLCDLSIPVAWWEISHFEEEQCPPYVDAVVRKRDPSADCISNEYIAARSALISSLRNAAQGTFVDEFVGYAPVLDAVAAALIKKPNLLAIRQRLENADVGTQDRIKLLDDILSSLLERDQSKVEAMVQDLGIQPIAAYTPAEQIEWLCHTLERSDAPMLSYIKDPALRQRYVEQISTFVDDHPFRSEDKWASPVFEAYVASRQFDKSVFTDSRLIEIGSKSGFLFDFVRGRGDLLISEAQLAALHASIVASEVAGSITSVSVTQGVDASYSGSFAIKRGPDRAQDTSFDLIPNQDDALRLDGPLSDLSVRTNGAIIVTGRSQEIVVGPDLFLSGADVRLEGSNLDLSRRPDSSASTTIAEASIVIEARNSIHLPTVLSQSAVDGEFEIRVPAKIKLDYPWFEYRSELDLEETLNQTVIRFLNKLMNLSRNHGHAGERGTYFKKFEGRQPFHTNDFNKALNVLVAEGVVRIESDIVFLRDEWEAHRYSGKALSGQRQFSDVKDVWSPIVKKIEDALSIS